LLKLAYIYVIKNEDKTQDLFLVDFDGNHVPIITIPSATRTYDNATWTFETTFPGFTYKTYELYQDINDSSNIRDPGTGTDLTGYQGPLVVESTVVYGPDYDEPRPLVIETAEFGLQEAWDKAIFRYGLFGNPGFTGDVNAKPGYTTFTDDIDDEDAWLDWSEVYSASPTTISYVAFADDNTPAMNISDGVGGPWGNLNPAYSGTGFGAQSNPTITTTLISSARWFVIAYDGPMTVSTPTGQSKPPPTDEYTDFEAYLSNANGELQILVRYTGRAPGDTTLEEDDPWFPEANIHKYTYIDSTLEEDYPDLDLPLWMSIFDSVNTRTTIADYYLGLFEGSIEDNETDALLYYIAATGGISDNFDFFVDGSRQDVTSGVNTVWGWFFEFLDSVELKSALFDEESPAEIKTVYSIYPAQVDYSFDLPGYGAGNGPDNNTAPIPFNTKEKPTLLFATTPKLDPEEFVEEDFTIISISASWSIENTILICHDTSKVVNWEAEGGS